ncbi:hypothetical protein Val02_87750 [Virgisporangium aliadipatigenens]|uniref:Amidotransferase n=1 Tax=Virgisporangium aliadipatigenens TaxID=741659 RepID=A0A8J3YU11_9ACTN|nr:hypothetical protein [Virgisporangium aliadipatigenens]GIJ51889.1 hypothetical protein Val02_87750 [Virgisporangium aliadipatigenens]
MSVFPIVLFGLAGVLLGGAWSLKRQGAPITASALLGVLAVMAAAAGVLRLSLGGE